MITPYYEQDGIAIYHGDCREILPQLDQRFDLVLTDPPYGVELGVANNQSNDGTHLRKQQYESYDDTYENFVSEIVPRLNEAIGLADCSAVFTGPHIHEQRKPSSIGGVYHLSATGRTPWGSKNFLPVLFYGNPPFPGRHRQTVITGTDVSEKVGHPCPKPIRWLKWLVELGSVEGDLVCDPFMGSGTTLVAAKQLGRRAVGIELEEKYCEIAVNRLRQKVFQFTGAPS